MGLHRRESHLKLSADKLLRAMAARGMSAQILAAESGVSPTTLSGLIHHGRPISPRSARRIAAALRKHKPIAELADLIEVA